MGQFIHGGDTYGDRKDFLDFSSNINPLGLPKTVEKALRESIGTWDRYPDPKCRDLISAIADSENLDEHWIHCGSGAAELTFHLVQSLRPKRALLTAPTFAEYERALRTCECEVTCHTLYEKDGFEVTDKILGKLDKALDLVILCNPNNPTGKLVEPMLMDRIVKRCAENGITLIVDECFIPFISAPCAYTLKEALEKNKHVILLRAFTKLYAMAGIRLGYAICSDTNIIEKLSDSEQPWNVSLPAQIAGKAALGDEKYLEMSHEWIASERPFLAEALKKMGLTVYDPTANYIFFKCHNRKDLTDRMEERKILIRSCANYKGLDKRFYRVAIKTHEANEKLINVLKEVLIEKAGVNEKEIKE